MTFCVILELVKPLTENGFQMRGQAATSWLYDEQMARSHMWHNLNQWFTKYCCCTHVVPEPHCTRRAVGQEGRGVRNVWGTVLHLHSKQQLTAIWPKPLRDWKMKEHSGVDTSMWNAWLDQFFKVQRVDCISVDVRCSFCSVVDFVWLLLYSTPSHWSSSLLILP